MVDEMLIDTLGKADAEVDAPFTQAFGMGSPDMGVARPADRRRPGQAAQGQGRRIAGDNVVMDVRLKSEALIPENSGPGPSSRSTIGSTCPRVARERREHRPLSCRPTAETSWQPIIDTTREGDVVEGTCMQDQGGLLVDISVPVLPASQVDVRRPHEIGEFIGRKIEAQILKIDKERKNIVISAAHRGGAEPKARLLEGLTEGQIVKGTVKNIADFGAFVDPAASTASSTSPTCPGPRQPPQRTVRIDDEIRSVLSIDRDKEKTLGASRRTPPWEAIEQSTRRLTSARAVNIMSQRLRPPRDGIGPRPSPRCPDPPRQPPLRDGQRQRRGRCRHPRHRQEQAEISSA